VRMVFGAAGMSSDGAADPGANFAIVPLAIPLLAGPAFAPLASDALRILRGNLNRLDGNLGSLVGAGLSGGRHVISWSAAGRRKRSPVLGLG